MKREQFLRKLKKLCKAQEIPYDWQPGEGNGSHGMVYVGAKKTTVQHGELPPDFIGTILKQLDLPKDAVK